MGRPLDAERLRQALEALGADLAARIPEDGDWDHHTCEFLDRFDMAGGVIVRHAAMIAVDPGRVGFPRPNADLGDVGEHPARRRR